MSNPYISVIVPVYGCKECLYELYIRLCNVLEKISNDFEILYIDDGAPDNPWSFILELAGKDSRLKGIRFSRNFGQHKAIAAGLEYSTGNWVVVMDCDLQDVPEELLKLHQKALEGYDVVLGSRNNRKDIFLKKLMSQLFYRILGYLTETVQDSTIGNFGIYNRGVVNAICSMHDSFRYFPTMVRWVGFSQTQIEIVHAERKTGKTSYSFKKLLNLGLEVMLAFSDKPLRLTVKAGIGISVLAILYTFFVLIEYATGKITVLGYTSLVISIWLLSGIIIFTLGMVGLYIGKTFESVKGRPLYVVKEKANV